MSCRWLILASLSLPMLLAGADAAKVKVWHQHTQAHYDKAKFDGAVVTSEGVLRLSRLVKPFAGLKATNVWDLAEDKAGNLYAATGDEGKLYKITPDGKASVAYTSKDAHIFSLTSTPDGAIYAGTGPTGKVIRIAPDGKAAEYADGLDSYVWSLAYDPDSKSVYAGTGPKGRIYRLAMAPAGKAEVHFATKQEHVLCLAAGTKGMLYAGTDKGGLVYRITPAGKAFVLYHANQPEVRSLLVTPDALYAGTSAPVARKGSGLFSSGTPKLDASTTSPPPGENSLYRIAPDGSVRELYRDKTMILRLLLSPGQGPAQAEKSILVATGMQGQLFEVNDATKERTEIARLEHGQIHCMLQRRDGSIVLGTGDPGKLYLLESSYAAKGTVLSEVLDTKIQSKWGAAHWRPTCPTGTTATIALRSGNVAEPDETWSSWSNEFANPEGAKGQVPLARYLQYRVTLSSDDPKQTPEFRQFSLRYQTLNQAPALTSLEVPDLDTKDLENPKKLKIRWSATDPNEDELTYALYFRKDGWKDWVLLEENFEKKEYEWDTAGIPSGLYQIKVTASDRKDNAAEEAYTVERVSVPIPVAHLPPTVSLKLVGFDGDQAVLEATASDSLVRLTEAAFAVDGKRWVNVFPTDGLFDGKKESFRFKTDGLRAGTHVVVLRVRNAAGILGSSDVVLRKE